MNEDIIKLIQSPYIIISMVFASIFAFIKLFNKTTNYYYFIFLGVIYSILEFIFRIPSATIGKNVLGISVVLLQILWVSINFISSSLLGIYMYNESITLNKIGGMILVLLGIFVSCNK